MPGYLDAITEDGKLRHYTFGENGGNAYETVEEMFGMIWYLAKNLAIQCDVTTDPAEWVARAERLWRSGISYSPGVEDE